VLEGIKKRKDRAKRKKGEKKDGDDEEAPVSWAVLLEKWSLTDRSPRLHLETPSTISSTTPTRTRPTMTTRRLRLREVDRSSPWPRVKRANERRSEKRSPSEEKMAKRTFEMRVTSRWICCLARLLEVSQVSFCAPKRCSRLIAASNPNAKNKGRKPGQDASHFKTDKSGKLIIPAEGSDDEMAGQVNTRLHMEGSAFMAAQHGVDGATRDSRGGLKFNKNTKRGRQEEEEMGIDLDEVMGPKKEPKKRKEQNKKLGEEFKAKVSSLSVDEITADDSALAETSSDKARRILTVTCLSDKLRRARVVPAG